jgi:glucokinase
MNHRAIGVDIGGTKTAVAVIDEAREPRHLTIFPTPATEGPDRIVESIAAAIRKLEANVSPGTPVGVGSAGVFDTNGTVRSATNTIRHWTGFPLAGALTTKIGRPVVAINDVHAAAVGEATASAGLADGFLMVTVGTGVGGALYGPQALLTGATGTAGSIGHLAARGRESRLCTCGQPGHIEAYASGPGMEQTFTELTGNRMPLREIVKMTATGDPQARAALADGSSTLGIGLADALNLLDYSTVVVGGGVASIGASYLDAVTRALRAAALPGPSLARVLPARLGANATVIGAGLHAARVFHQGKGSDLVQGVGYGTAAGRA